jgi:hypothetical protein
MIQQHHHAQIRERNEFLREIESLRSFKAWISRKKSAKHLNMLLVRIINLTIKHKTQYMERIITPQNQRPTDGTAKDSKTD